jgi:hypothetical protein
MLIRLLTSIHFCSLRHAVHIDIYYVDPDVGLYYHLFTHHIKFMNSFGRTGPGVITECSVTGL